MIWISRDAKSKYLEARKLDLAQCFIAVKVSEFSKIEKIGYLWKGSAEALELDEINEFGRQLEQYALASNAQKITEILVLAQNYLEKELKLMSPNS
jgi:hypothetical protein